MEDDSIDVEADHKMTVWIWEMTVSIWEMTISIWEILSLCQGLARMGTQVHYERPARSS